MIFLCSLFVPISLAGVFLWLPAAFRCIEYPSLFFNVSASTSFPFPLIATIRSSLVSAMLLFPLSYEAFACA